MHIKKYSFIFIKVVVTLFSATPFLNEFSKECYRIAGVRESEVKLSIKLGLLKSDTNEFYMFISPSFTELLYSKYDQKYCLFFLLYYILCLLVDI